MFALLLIPIALTCASAAQAVPSLIDEVAPGIYVARDDTGMAWGGWSMGVAHMNSARYQAKKMLDLSDLPEDAWARVRQVRLAAYIIVNDYSPVQNPPANGLDEQFEVVVNGIVHTYPTSVGVLAWRDDAANRPEWYDFILPKDEFVRGPNEIIIRKAPSGKNDDFLYVGIDAIDPRGNSFVTFDGETWTQQKLTVPGGNGEYMVRLHLLAGDPTTTATWDARTGELTDPAGLILYAGAHGAEGGALAPGQRARMEWPSGALDRLSPATVAVEATGPVQIAWLDPAGEPGEASPGPVATLPAGRREHVSGVVLIAGQGGAQVRSITVTAALSHHPRPEPIDMAPVLAPPPPPAAPRPPACEMTADAATLSNATVSARFEFRERLRLASLRHELVGVEMARSPEDIALFLVEVGEQRYAGSRNFALVGVEPVEGGFAATLELPEPPLRAELTATIDDEGLRLGLDLANAGETSLDFKLAFPSLSGLAVSDDPARDYYYFPYGGGIIADRPAILRAGYGDYQALWQLIDLYSPARGCGLYLRVDDDEGWHKTMALRRHVPGRAEQPDRPLIAPVRPEYQWREPSLAPVQGTGLAVEYLRRTREPGASFAPEPAVLAAHPGDWHVAMQRYADWAHRVFTWRPWPSRLLHVHNMIDAGWGQDVLFRDGAYRTDIIKPRMDCVELMSWWEWSELGPFGLPIERAEEIMTPAQIQERARYFDRYIVSDPVTGKQMWNNQPGDYRGYNERFGGLPALRAAIQTWRGLGARLVTLYTDPFRLDHNYETGRAHGEDWGVVNVHGEKSRNHFVWQPCHDLPEVRAWIARELGRVMRETGADGIRLDEYGHAGWACYDETHRHTFAEPGITQWNKAVAETTRMVHEAMDQVRPDLVLTTEFPCYDYLMQHIEGCITYDLSIVASLMRPLECNLQRFYFPECKAYELDLGGANFGEIRTFWRGEVGDRKKFWNAVESFGRCYPVSFYAILSESEDAYQLGEPYPLLVTPGNARGVYVNRFAAPGKTLYHLYNATGHTFEGEALAVPLAAGEHLFDLLAGAEVEPVARADGLAGVHLYLPRDEVACIAQLTRLLAVTRAAEALRVHVDLPGSAAASPGECTLVVADGEGQALGSQAALAGANTIDLSALPADSAPACVKLLRGGQLVDIAAVPGP
ncbi:MAG: hypothetical protein AB7Y46_06360 [Armatimonadota bacterium]